MINRTLDIIAASSKKALFYFEAISLSALLLTGFFSTLNEFEFTSESFQIFTEETEIHELQELSKESFVPRFLTRIQLTNLKVLNETDFSIIIHCKFQALTDEDIKSNLEHIRKFSKVDDDTYLLDFWVPSDYSNYEVQIYTKLSTPQIRLRYASRTIAPNEDRTMNDFLSNNSAIIILLVLVASIALGVERENRHVSNI